MKNSIFRWFFITIFCFIYSIGVQASPFNYLTINDLKALEAGSMSVEKVIKTAKESKIPKIFLGDIVRLIVGFYPEKEEIEKDEAILNAIIHVVQVIMKGENVQANQANIMLAGIGILIKGSGVGITDDILSAIDKIADAAKEVNIDASELIDEVVEEIKESGVANEGLPTSPN